jgi:hypothetical protein
MNLNIFAETFPRKQTQFMVQFAVEACHARHIISSFIYAEQLAT